MEGTSMTTDNFRPRELVDISNLASQVEKFNKDQFGDKPLFAEVVFYRDGNDVAMLTESASVGVVYDGLSFEVKERGN